MTGGWVQCLRLTSPTPLVSSPKSDSASRAAIGLKTLRSTAYMTLCITFFDPDSASSSDRPPKKRAIAIKLLSCQQIGRQPLKRQPFILDIDKNRIAIAEISPQNALRNLRFQLALNCSF